MRVFTIGFIALAALAGTGSASAQTFGTGSNPNSHSVGGYTKQNGTYVAPHQQTNPNDTQRDNYGAKGNYNQYNGKTGTKPPKY